MKKVVKASSSQRAQLYVEYIDQESSMMNMGIEKAIIDRPSLKEAAEVLVNNLNLPHFGIDDIESASAQDILDTVMYINGEDYTGDYIFVLKDNASGKVYIDHNYDIQRW